MKAAGTSRPHPPLGKLLSLVILAIAIALVFYALHRSALLPSTDAATIDADIVHVAASVGGRIISIPVAENARVSEGDLLFQIDPVPYPLAVAQAEADLAIAEAALATQQRVLSTQRSAATVAKEQTQRATANLELANRTVERLRPLAAKGYVPTQQLDQAQTAQRDAETSLQQAREQETATARAVDTDEGSQGNCAGAARRARDRASQSLKNAEAVEAAANDRYKNSIGTVIEVSQARQATAQARLTVVQATGAAQNTYLI